MGFSKAICERRAFTSLAVIVALIVTPMTTATAASAGVKRDVLLTHDDVVYPKLALVFAAGESSKVIERSSFNMALGTPLQDRCEIRLNDQDTSNTRAIGRVKFIDQIRVDNMQPRFEVEKFVTDFRKAVPHIFSTMIKQDSAEGIVFRKDDLHEEMSQILSTEPMRQVPKGFRARLEQSLITHLWGCYGDLLKYKSAASQSLARRMTEFKSLWSNKLVTDVELGLRQQTKGRKVGSDQMAKTRVSMNLKQGVPGVPDPRVSIDCMFEGPPSLLNIERMNAVLSPYFEVFSRQQYRQLVQSSSLPLRQTAGEQGQFY